MIENKKILAVIPARGGSKGIPNKNIKKVAGKPLIAWTIEAAKQSGFLDRIILSSENDSIIEVARKFGCEVPFVRPPELSGDDVPGIEPLLHAVTMLPNYDYVVLLQPTSPLRTHDHIDDCIMYCISSKAKSCVSVTVSDKNPYWMYFLNERKKLKSVMSDGKKISCRQELPVIYTLNGAIYIFECKWLLANKILIDDDTVGYEMDQMCSIDIDYKYQFHIADLLLRERNSNPKG
jgi:N-acylneuraminate cytidylyltransferase